MHDAHDVMAIVFGCAQSMETEHEANSAQCCATHPWQSTCELHDHGNCRVEFTQGKQATTHLPESCAIHPFTCANCCTCSQLAHRQATIPPRATIPTGVPSRTPEPPSGLTVGRGRPTSPQYSSNLPTVQVRTSDSYKDESVKL